MKKPPPPPAQVLPREAALRLQAAASTPLDRRRIDPGFNRTVAIEKAAAQAQHEHPHLFRKD